MRTPFPCFLPFRWKGCRSILSLICYRCEKQGKKRGQRRASKTEGGREELAKVISGIRKQRNTHAKKERKTEQKGGKNLTHREPIKGDKKGKTARMQRETHTHTHTLQSSKHIPPLHPDVEVGSNAHRCRCHPQARPPTPRHHTPPPHHRLASS